MTQITSNKTMTALAQWMALDATERAAFERAVAALAGAGVGACEPVEPAARDEAAQLPFAGWPGLCGGGAVVAPLPAGSGQRPPRMQIEGYDRALFSSRTYDALPKHGRALNIYVASSSGTADLYRATATCIYKAGTTVGRIADRIEQLNGIGYAGWRRAGQGLVEEPGYRSWRSERLPLTAPRPQGSPVGVTQDGLAVTLPASMDVEAFDVALTAALAPVSIASLLVTPKFRLSLLAQGCDPQVLERYSPRSDGTGHKRVAELVRLMPRRDADDLAALAESIVATHVAGSSARAA